MSAFEALITKNIQELLDNDQVQPHKYTITIQSMTSSNEQKILGYSGDQFTSIPYPTPPGTSNVEWMFYAYTIPGGFYGAIEAASFYAWNETLDGKGVELSATAQRPVFQLVQSSTTNGNSYAITIPSSSAAPLSPLYVHWDPTICSQPTLPFGSDEWMYEITGLNE